MGRRKRKQSFSLPGDVVSEILCRLPLKSLCRFRLVSKSWLYTISCSIPFAKMIENQNKPRCLLFCHGIEWPIDTGRLDLPLCVKAVSRGELSREFDVYESDECFDDKIFVGSANGLLCFSSACCPFYGYYICNPITKEDMETPEGITKEVQFFDREVVAGFGFDSSSNSFKVVRIVSYTVSDWNSNEGSYEVEADVYNQDSGRWQKIENVPYIAHRAVAAGQSGVFVNGSLHWFEQSECTLISLEMASEKFRTTKLAIVPTVNFRNRITIGVLNDFMCISYYIGEKRMICVSKNQNYEELECWVEEHVFSGVKCYFPYLDGNQLVKSMHDGFIVRSFNDTLGFYDPNSAKFKSAKVKNYYSTTIVFRGSLFSPKKTIKHIAIEQVEI